MGSSSTEEATFTVALQNKMSSPAQDAASSLQQLRDKVIGGEKALRNMEAAQRRLRGGTVQDIATHKRLRDQITAQRASIAAAQQSYIKLGGSLDDLGKKAEGTEGGLARLGTAAEGVGGPIGGIVGKFKSLASLVEGGGVIAAGSLAIAAAILAVAAAAITATAALLQYGLAQSDARRSELLHLEGLTTIRRWYGLARGSGQELQAQIDRFADSTTLARGAVAGYAEQLYRMGLRGRNATAALDAVTLAAQVQGQAGAARAASWAAGLARTGGDVTRLAALMRSRLGGIAERQVLSLSNQTAKLHERLARIFGDLRIEGFLRALNSITTLFSQSTAEGQALKAMIEGLFNPIFDAMGSSAPLVRRFFQGMILGAQSFVIAVLQVRAWVHRTFGKDFTSQIGGATTALDGGKLVVYALVGALGAAAIAAAALAAPFVFAAATGAALFEVFDRINRGAMAAATRLLTFGKMAMDLDWAMVGRSMVDGIVRGILAAKSYLVESVRGIADTARSTLVDALGIHSPSRVFAELGAQVPRGFAAGVGNTMPMAGAAVSAMAGGAVGAGASTAGGRGDRSITVQELHVHAASGEPAAIAAAVKEALASVLEGAAIEMGSPA